MRPAPRSMPPDGDDLDMRAMTRVFVDGDALRDVIAYDCDAGWVMVISHNDLGEKVSDGENWVATKIYGEVRAVIYE